MTKQRAMAFGKIGLGGLRITSGLLTAAGHGFVGKYCRSHNLPTVAGTIVRESIKGGIAMVKEGLKELNE
jgi:hypothetical protein